MPFDVRVKELAEHIEVTVQHGLKATSRELDVGLDHARNSGTAARGKPARTVTAALSAQRSSAVAAEPAVYVADTCQ